jgi:hypothetical protein
MTITLLLMLLLLLAFEEAFGWRCSGCPADPKCTGACPKCDSLCGHGHCGPHNQCTCAPTFGKPQGHGCDACAPGFSGYPNCVEDPPGARYACSKAGRCVDTPAGPYPTSTCANQCGGGHHHPVPSPPPAPPTPGHHNGTCGSSCRGVSDCAPRRWTSNASDTGCSFCDRYGNHTGPLCMTLEAKCCNHECPGERQECFFKCDYRTNRSHMPQHLLIGDSITDGQFPFVKTMLNATLDSHLIPINGGDTGEGQTCASVWAQDLERWDIISYNFGAWDIGSSDCNLTKDASGQYLDARLEEYISRLANITAQLKHTRAGRNGNLVFVLTTPSPDVPECCDDPKVSPAGHFRAATGTHTCVKRTIVFNEAARALLVQLGGIHILDLYAFVAQKCPTPYTYDCSIQTMKKGDPCQVHFDNPLGWEYVAHGYAAGIQRIFHNSHVRMKTDDASPPSAEELQHRINVYIAAGARVFYVPSGEYYFGNRTLLIQNATDFALVARGPVTFWFTNSDGGFMLRGCSNVTVMGDSPTTPLRIDRSPPPFSQGTLTNLTAKTMEFKLDGDSPDPRALEPSRNPSAGPGMIDVGMCSSWKVGSRSSDGREDSRGMPTGHACFPTSAMCDLGPGRFTVARTSRNSDVSVGDQFVFILWRGFSYVVANSSDVVTQDVAVHAAGDMAVFEGDGGGGHTYRRLKVVPRNGRLISSNADAFHSSDMERGPKLENCHFKSMLDDFFNFQSTLLLATNFSGLDGTLTLVHPHTSDQADDFAPGNVAVTDHWYGTTEPLSRLRAGDQLIFYDPFSFEEVGRTRTAAHARLLSPATDQNSTLAQRADALVGLLRIGEHCHGFSCTCDKGSSCWSAVSKQHYPVQRFRASVYSVELAGALPLQPRSGPMVSVIPFVVQIAKTQSAGVSVSQSLFEDSRGFFGRWKSSDSTLSGNIFRGNAQPELEMQLLPQFYEGPISISNVSIINNSFEIGRACNPKKQACPTMSDLLDSGPSCCKVQNLVVMQNRVVMQTDEPQ